jgi:hypothetical protein
VRHVAKSPNSNGMSGASPTITMNEGAVAVAAVHALVSLTSMKRSRRSKGHGLTHPHPLSPLKLKVQFA